MRKAISTFVFVKSRLHPGTMDKLVQFGAEAIEIFASRGHFDYTDRQHVREIGAWCKESGIPLNSVHAPMFPDYEWGRTGTAPVNIIDPDKRRRVESMDEVKRALEVAETVPFDFLVQHLGVATDSYDPAQFDNALSSLEHLHAFARPLGVKILLENLPNEITSPENLVQTIAALHFDDLGVCFDTGHAHLAGGVEEGLRSLQDLIRSTHVHDNNKIRDEHLFPGEGSIDWKSAMALLREAKHVPPLLLEIEGDGRKDIAEKFGEAFRLLENTCHRDTEAQREQENN